MKKPEDNQESDDRIWDPSKSNGHIHQWAKTQQSNWVHMECDCGAISGFMSPIYWGD